MPGIDGEPFGRVTSNGRIRPPLMKPITVGDVANMTCVSPASSDWDAGPPPLNWMFVNFTPAAVSNPTEARCGADPNPAEAENSLPGFAFANAISSLALLNGELFGTTRIVVPIATRQIGMKSLSSYARFLYRPLLIA